MFTAFNRQKLLDEVNQLKTKAYKTTTTYKRTNTGNLFISEGQLPERATIITIKFDSLFYKQSKHIIDIDKLDSLIDTLEQIDVNNAYSGILISLVTHLRDNQYDKYRTKTGKLMIPCLNDVDYYCSLCNLLQTMRTIKSQNLEQLNQSSRYYEIVELIYKIADIIASSIYRIEELVLPCLLYDEQQMKAEVKFITITNKENFNKIASTISESMKEEGYFISDIQQLAFKIRGHQIDNYNYEIEDVSDVKFNDDVDSLIQQLGIISEYNEYKTQWSESSIKAILHKRTLNMVSEIEADFDNLIDSTIDMIVEETKQLLEMES